MPPEQMRGEEVGPPADVFAVGTLLYEGWTARAPFRRRTAELSQSALSEPVAPLSTFDPSLAALDALIGSALAIDPADRPRSAEELSRPLRRFISDRDLGDLTRKVGERVRMVRSARESDPGPKLLESPAGVTPVASETRTFATRAGEAIAREIPTAPSKPPRHDPAPYIATRRMSDDAGTGPRAGEGASARTSVRPARSRPLRGIVGLAIGVLVVAAASGAAWRFGDAKTPASIAGGSAATPHGATPTALANKALETVDPRAPVNEDPSSPPATHAAGDAGANGAAGAERKAPAASARAGANGVSSSPANRATPTAGEAASAAAGGETPLAHLRILANPMANVEIDGKPRGPAPIADIALPPGTHFVRLDCAALGEAVAQNVPVGPGESVTISGDFTGAHGRILVRRTGPSP